MFIYSFFSQLTLGENLADNGGVFASLSAYRKSLQMEASANSQQRLPGLEKFSQEALFFINFGRLWCKKLRPEVALRYVSISYSHCVYIAKTKDSIFFLRSLPTHTLLMLPESMELLKTVKTLQEYLTVLLAAL